MSPQFYPIGIGTFSVLIHLNFLTTLLAFAINDSQTLSSVNTCSPSNYSARSLEPNEKLLTLDKVRRSYREINFALRGPIYFRALELSKELANGLERPYRDVIKASIVDSQGTGQKPNTFLRQLVALVTYPELMHSSTFPSDVVQRAKDILADLAGHTIGSLTNARGIDLVRKHVSRFLTRRDGIESNPENIFLANGVSGGLAMAFKLVQWECRDTNVGVMVPIPLYPLYSALLTEHGLRQISYNLNPNNDWAIEMGELERAYEEARCKCECQPRVLVIINPGNPSGKIQRRSKLESIIRFAYNRSLILFADEIYQHSILADVEFISTKKVLMEMGAPYNKMELIAFHSISKGYMSEGGLRGGYIETVNLEKGIGDIFFRLLSVKQCPNVMGQVGLDALMNPPVKGDPSFELHEKEKSYILDSHREIAVRLTQGLNSVPGFKCSTVEGAAVVFPKITIPDKAVKAAEAEGIYPDLFYGLQLLESVGVSVAVGTAFGLPPSKTYLRISIPSSMEECEKILESIGKFNKDFLIKYT